MSTFNFSGVEETYTVPATGKYQITAVGAGGALGNSYSGSYGSVPGKGGRITGTFNLTSGNILHIIVGGIGSGGSGTAKDGSGGGSGGGTFIFREISSITDSRYQFNKSGKNYEVLLVAPGGGGTGDESYKSAKSDGVDGKAAAYKSPNNYTAFSTATANPASSSSASNTLGIQQYITYNAAGGMYSRNSSFGQGGFGCGSASDDNPSPGGGWSGDATNGSYGWSLDTSAVGVDGVQDGNGVAIISPFESFEYSGTEKTYTIPFSGKYEIDAVGAGGAVGNSYSGNYGSIPGKGGRITGKFDLQAGDILHIIVGGKGSGSNGTAKDGASGGGGGGSFVFREIASITDSRWQFTKSGKNYEVLLVAPGGGGTGDQSYKSGRSDGIDGKAAAFKSPNNYTEFSKAYSTSSSSDTMGITQYINNNAAGGTYSRSSSVSQGGYGCGGAADDNPTAGGGWSGSYSTGSYGWCLDTAASGIDGIQEGNGSVKITEAPNGAWGSEFELTSAAMSPNPANMNTNVTLTVSILEKEFWIEPAVYPSGEFYSGEV